MSKSELARSIARQNLFFWRGLMIKHPVCIGLLAARRILSCISRQRSSCPVHH